MASGSEQFLGQQLSKQAQALGELVMKMQEVIINTGNAVSKFTVASDEVQVSKIYEPVKRINDTTNKIDMVVFVSGVINVKVTGKGVNASQYLSLYKNGVLFLKHTTPFTSSEGYKEVVFNVTVEEGDNLLLQTNDLIEISKVEFCYTELPKPGGVING